MSDFDERFVESDPRGLMIKLTLVLLTCMLIACFVSLLSRTYIGSLVYFQRTTSKLASEDSREGVDKRRIPEEKNLIDVGELLNDPNLNSLIGGDAFLAMRVLRLCFTMCAISSVYLSFTILPCYLATYIQSSSRSQHWLQLLSFDRLPHNEPSLSWVPVICSWTLTLLLVKLCDRESDQSINSTCQTSIDSYTLLVTRLPNNIHNDHLVDLLEKDLGVTTVQHSTIYKQGDDHVEIIESLFENETDYKSTWPNIQHLGHSIKYNLISVTETLLGKEDPLRSFWSALFVEYQLVAFVTLKSLKDVLLLSKCTNTGSLAIEAAPSPTNILWRNLCVSSITVRARSHIASTLLTIALIFYPAVFIWLRRSLRKKEKSKFDELWNVHYISMVNYVVLILIVPKILRMCGVVLERYRTVKEVEETIFSRYYVIHCINLLVFVFGFAGEAWLAVIDVDMNKLGVDLIRNFESIGRYVPLIGLYFCAYIAYSSLGVCGSLIAPIQWLKLLYYKITVRDTDDILQRVPLRTMYVSEIVIESIFILNICMIFAVISPFVLPLGMLYFAVAWLVYGYQFVYMHAPLYDTNAESWRAIRKVS